MNVHNWFNAGLNTLILLRVRHVSRLVLIGAPVGANLAPFYSLYSRSRRLTFPLSILTRSSVDRGTCSIQVTPGSFSTNG